MSVELVYAGSITIRRYRTKLKGHSVGFGKCGHHGSFFGVQKYGTEEAAFEAAKSYRRETSDKLGLTTVRPSMESFWERVTNCGFLHTENQSNQYFAGFLDGDGCISMSKEYLICVGVSQSCDSQIPLVIEYLQYRYGGCLSSTKRNARTAHIIRVSGLSSVPILTNMATNSILKTGQAEIALHCFGGEVSKEDIYNQLANCKLLESYQRVNAREYTDRLTLPYIAGIFDAEGCITFDGSIRVKLAQRSSPSLLGMIHEFFGGRGSVENNDYIVWHAADAASVLELIEPYLVYKRDQAICALKIREYSTIHVQKRTVDDKNHIVQLASYIKSQKYT